MDVPCDGTQCAGDNDTTKPSVQVEETRPAVECRLRVHEFSGKLFDSQVHFQCVGLKDSFILWIGTRPASMTNLAMAIPTRFDKTPLSVGCLADSESDNISHSLAQKLAKRSGKQVFVSYNLPADYQLLSLVQQRLFEEMTLLPQHF